MDLKDINIEPSTIPKCPDCGNLEWIVYERISRFSKLERVDGLRDLVVQDRDESTYDQALKLRCVHCGSEFLPQAEVGSKAECWHPSTGLADWPGIVVNEEAYD